MDNSKEQINASQARAELESLQKISKDCLLRTVPPLWFTILLPLLVGTIFTLSAIGASRWYMAPFMLAGLFLTVYDLRQTKVILYIPSKPVLFFLLICAICVFGAPAFYLRYYYESNSLWPGLAFGLAYTVIGFFLLRFEHRLFQFKINRFKKE